jgi:hypothetical protein
MGFGQAALSTDLATQLRIYDPSYYDPLYIKRYGELVAYAQSVDNQRLNLSRSDVQIDTNVILPNVQEARRSRLLDLESVGYLLYKREEFSKYFTSVEPVTWQDNNWVIVKNSSALPRAYFVNSFEIINSSQAILRRLYDASFDPSRTVILEERPVIGSTVSAIHQQANVISYKPNEVLIDATTENASILVLTDNYDPGWDAYVDNKKTQLYRVNYSFRAIVVPAGSHRIRFVYQPLSFLTGAYISCSIFILLGFILMYSIRSSSSHIQKKSK